MSTSRQIELLRKIVRELIQQELGESSMTGNLDGGAGPPKTPYAFQSKPKSKKDKDKEDDMKKATGYTKVNEAKFHVKTEIGSVIVDAGGKGDAVMKVAKALKKGRKGIISVNRVGVSKAKQVDKKLEAHIPFHTGGKKTTIGDEPEEKRKKESVSEGKYHDWRNDETLSPKQKIGKSVREVRHALDALDKTIKMNVRLKNELSVDSRNYWKNTHKALSKISERLVKLATKVGSLK